MRGATKKRARGVRIRPGVVRAGAVLLGIAAVAVAVREFPELRRYIKAETM